MSCLPWVDKILAVGLLLGMAWPVSAAELKQILQRGHLIVAVKDNLRPLGFRDAAGQLQGLEIDLARRLAQELLGDQNALVLKPVANTDRITAVVTGEVDLAIADLTATPARARIVNFSQPYYLAGMGILVKDQKIQRLEDLANQPVAVLQGSSAIAKLRFLLPSVQMIAVSSYQQGRSLLDGGQVRAMVADSPVLTGLVQASQGYILLPTLLSAEPLAIAFPKGLQYQDLQARLKEISDRWQSEGWLAERIRYWGLPSSSTNLSGQILRSFLLTQSPVWETPVRLTRKQLN
jgi:polar amino acid transport system substrate-binding protein